MAKDNKPVRNPSLVSSISKMHENKSLVTWLSVVDDIFDAHFLCPVKIEPSSVSGDGADAAVTNEDTVIGFHLIENEQRQSFCLAFTGRGELRKWTHGRNQPTITMTFGELAAVVVAEGSKVEGIVVNPMGQDLLMTHKVVENLVSEMGLRAYSSLHNARKKKSSMHYPGMFEFL